MNFSISLKTSKTLAAFSAAMMLQAGLVLGASDAGAGAALEGKVTELRGVVHVGPKGASRKLRMGGVVKAGEMVTGGGDAFARMDLPAQSLALRGPFSFEFTQEQIRLDQGKMRVSIPPGAGPKAVRMLKTPTASLGVRGTDFLSTYDQLLGETEIVCFEHEVRFQAGGDDVVVPAGHWGGNGGRFGAAIRPPMKLDEKILNAFRAQF